MLYHNKNVDALASITMQFFTQEVVIALVCAAVFIAFGRLWSDRVRIENDVLSRHGWIYLVVFALRYRSDCVTRHETSLLGSD